MNDAPSYSRRDLALALITGKLLQQLDFIQVYNPKPNDGENQCSIMVRTLPTAMIPEVVVKITFTQIS